MIKKFKFVVLIPCLLLIFLYSNKSFALELDLANYPTPYQIINNGGMDVYYVSGTDGTLNYECEKQCGELVSANIGTKVVGDGGFYYNYLDTPNENGVKGLFFPAYFSCTDGSYVGCAPSYPDYESVKPRIIEPTAADKKKDENFFAAVAKYPQMLQKNYSNWAGFVAELDTVYKYSDNIYFYYSQSTLPGQTNQASILAQEIAFQTLISDGSPSGMNSYRQSGWPGSGAGSLPERGDTGNGYGCGYQPGETVFRYIFCGLNVDPIQYIDIPFVGYHWNGYNFCFEAEKKTESSKYVKLGDINEEWFAHNGWAYDESANLIYPTPEKIASYYPNYGKTIAQVCEEYNAKGMTILEPWGGQLFIPSEYNNVVIGEWFQIFDNYYGYRLKMPF